MFCIHDNDYLKQHMHYTLNTITTAVELKITTLFCSLSLNLYL